MIRFTKFLFNTIILSILFISIQIIAQVSPEKDIEPPTHFKEFHKMIQSTYSSGYYAAKFRDRKQVREQLYPESNFESLLTTDTVNALTLMGQYSDLAGYYSQQQFQAHLYDGPNPTGTVTDYYSETSYGQLHFTGDAKGWYTLPRTLAQYVGSNSGLGPQGGPRFVWELLQTSDPNINFADYIQYYDSQGRPRIGFIAVVHSGADAAAGAYNIWSHRWNFTVYSGGSFTTNDIDPVSGFNVIIDGDYAIMPELEGSNNQSGPIKAIGVFAHEFGHIFGLPDLYDTDNSSSGLGNWCLMAGGSYGGNGNSAHTPVHLSAWCKKELGWLTPINFNSFQDNLSVENVEENPFVYRMWRNGLMGAEYFLIENRQKIGFDSNIYDSGFLIYHVDETQPGNQNENRYKVDLEQADGFRNLNLGNNRGDPGDPFPGSSNNVRFDWNTNPNSKDYSLQDTWISIRNIYKSGNLMVGDFDVGPRNGVYAFRDPLTINFGEVEINTSSMSKKVILANYGTQNLVISNIPSSSGDFQLETLISFPVTLSTFDSLTLYFKFTPSTVGSYQEVYPVESNDLTFPGFAVQGESYLCFPALEKTFYASSGSQNNGNIITIDPLTGSGSTIGSSLLSEVTSISINPVNGKMYGLVASTTSSDIVKINAAGGDAHTHFKININQMVAIAFDTSGVLYGITRSGNLYTIDLDNGTTSFVVDAVGSYLGMAFHPQTNELWASSRAIVPPNKDAIFKVNMVTGDTTIIGRTGLGKQTNDIIFDENANLYGVIGAASEFCDFVSINTNTGAGTIIGNIGSKNILSLAYIDKILVSVDDELNITIPSEYSLKQNYPNPFNPATKIEFALPSEANVKLIVYNILGQEVKQLVNDQMSAGNHSVIWNATDANGNKLTSGIYLYKLIASGNNGKEFQEVRKMILLK